MTIKGVGGGPGLKFESSFLLTYVVALYFLILKWAQPPLNSYRLKFGGLKRKGGFREIAKYIGNPILKKMVKKNPSKRFNSSLFALFFLISWNKLAF